MQRAIKYFIDYYTLDDITQLYALFKSEIDSEPSNYFPNPLQLFLVFTLSEPLYVELKDLMVCPGDLQKCLSHFGHRKDQRNLVVDELDWHDEDDDITEGAW
ncbi:hypothetical protein niasHT_005040 [Heterodera trifolii]|uniref:Uncharacterized protein n=1 Tax=Heterodera trifolii TaxID=157864 RepID=A0ABD2ME81_9BILA